MTGDCEICQGSKRIRLPVYRMVVAITDAANPDSLDDMSREYPCPECSGGAPYERLGIIKWAKDYPEHLADNPHFIERLRYGMAQELVRAMVDRGIIRFEQGKTDARGVFKTRATVGVVAPSVVAKFEERVAERQFDVAEAVVAATEAEISNWGSYYGIQTVAKFDAVRWMAEALRKVKAKYGR